MPAWGNSMNEEIMISFENVTRAITAEQELIKRGFDVRVMFMPEILQNGCGFCLRLYPDDFKKASDYLAEIEIEIRGAWKKSSSGEFTAVGAY
ncbi:MAG: hypothetical protein Ta2G_02970 [Termitinemataceae bacterium]|nr:MAG: hypothetical protein Ta2G_02970 [Termitinemataceae bacterium]